MPALTHMRIGALDLGRFAWVLPAGTWEEFSRAVAETRGEFEGRVLWNVNSTARGGGVAEMLASLLAYLRGAGIDARWAVISGDEPFFTVTKRIHNNLHGVPGDGGDLGDAEREILRRTTERNAPELLELVQPDDVVLVHDPQPAGLIPILRDTGCTIVWRCHIGLDTPNELARRAWRFLLPDVRDADAYVFSREAYRWEGLDPARAVLIAPSIDAFAAKNQELDRDTVDAILAVAGLDDGWSGSHAPTFTREDGSPGRVERRAELWEGRPVRRDDRMVLQVSRWDALKDPLGVIRGFAEHVAPQVPDVHLVYAGPAVDAVADDPEGTQVLDQARAAFEAMEPEIAARVHLAALPMDDLEENAVIVNALQRRADVVVQKSLAEGFGLTVAEAMWKARPVLASRIGGIQDQIADGETGVLLDDPTDLPAFGAAVRRLLDDPDGARRMGEAARETVRREYLGTSNLMRYFALWRRLRAARQRA
jgi:trehalose synthase